MKIPAYVDGLPNLSGSEEIVGPSASRFRVANAEALAAHWSPVRSAYAIALHMHQPLIPDPDEDLSRAEIISNLAYMMKHQDVGDNHNAPVFCECYRRMGEFIPELVREGGQPRVMLDYSGTLLHGLLRMGLHDVFDALRRITCEPEYRDCVEWLGSAWGHPVAPSTPVADYRLHVLAWRHFFAGLFGLDALSRVQGFSPAEMALPNHPDVFYEFVRTLKDCGYRWVLVQEHTVERVEDGGALEAPHRPHRLVARNSAGRTLAITAIVKTQGSDTKLVGQMQPYYEARGLDRVELGGKAVPPLVCQIADGENGGVMMNEFSPKFMDVMRESSGTETPPVNVSEYIDYLDSLGVREEDLPAIQPVMQHRIWQRFDAEHPPVGAGTGTYPETRAEEQPQGTAPTKSESARMASIIEQLRREDPQFHVEGGSWTSDISWTRGYQDVLKPMESASAVFHETVRRHGVPSSDPRYRNALFHLLTSQLSCFRYWGEGTWTDWGREICRRVTEILKHDFPSG